MSIFATGAGTPQTTSVTNASAQIFSTTQSGLSGTLKSVLIQNSGTVTAYISSGTAATATVANGVALPASTTMHIGGTAVNYYAITASGTTSIIAGLATLRNFD